MANVSFRADVFFLGHEFDIFYMDMIFCKKKIEYYDVKML